MSVNREHLSPYAIEKVAEALMKNDGKFARDDWPHLSERQKKLFRSDAVVAITAYETALQQESV